MAEEHKSELMCSPHDKNGNFICGVVEGFYGRPWTTEQRKDLFQKLKKWGMDSYLYAPKDDYKHRAYWRELYTVEEAEHLTGLISTARENGIVFYYAVSPGLDITYSSAKEVGALKRKLEQVSQFGCQAFALLFDDIEPEMSEADKEVFQSFAHAQVSITNEIFQHLSQPKFLLCPTQYCAARAMPNVQNSEYLNTIGTKLAPEIDIMWTGPKVISRLLTVESIEEITDVLRRPPVIWDNLHANDYDQKRVFLGPYSGRSPDLMRKLKGVLTNPNCEYGANFVAIHTLAQWSRCSMDGKRDLSINDPVSADIKLETETEDGGVEDVPSTLSPNMYHPRRALRNAIVEWLAEFKRPRPAWGPIAKPQIVAGTSSASSATIPILPSVNTCMSITTTTTSSSTGCIPVATPNSSQLQALAEGCGAMTPESLLQPTPGAMMNSLMSENKVVCSDDVNPPLLSSSSSPNLGTSAASSGPSTEPMDCNPTPELSPCHQNSSSSDAGKSSNEDVAMADNVSTCSGAVSITPTGSSNMQIESLPGCSSSMQVEDIVTYPDRELTAEDLGLLCDLFYLPFEHGTQGLQLLQEFNWLKMNAHLVTQANRCGEATRKPEVQEWYGRAARLDEMTQALNQLFQRLTFCNNRELLYDLYPYVWDMRGVVSLLNSYVKWLASSGIPQTAVNYIQGTYTWFSKGWKEAFMSGEQEPWVFRGGLTADLQRLIPVDSGSDLFIYKPPDVPSSKIYTIRPYLPTDEVAVYDVCRKTCDDGMDGTEVFSGHPNLIGDKLIGSYLTLSSEFCFVVEDDWGVVGYALAALDSRVFANKVTAAWVPEMCDKYPKPEPKDSDMMSLTEEAINGFHNFKSDVPDSIHNHHPSCLTSALLTSVLDQSVAKRLITCLLAALRANGSFGCHVELSTNDKYLQEFYTKLGFVELGMGMIQDNIYLGRTF